MQNSLIKLHSLLKILDTEIESVLNFYTHAVYNKIVKHLFYESIGFFE